VTLILRDPVEFGWTECDCPPGACFHVFPPLTGGPWQQLPPSDFGDESHSRQPAAKPAEDEWEALTRVAGFSGITIIL
jgi:hypothetical protein